ncbi:MAG: hypothetical protein AB8G11_00520 [Saprospiraceae bacterium]
MEIYQIIEYVVIGGIIILQIFVFLKILGKMNFLKNAIPDGSKFKLIKGYLPDDANAYTINSVIDFFNQHYQEGHFGKAEIWEEAGDKISGKMSLIQTMTDSPFINKLIFNLNTYLIKNKGAAADFHLIKDLVERNVELEEQEIEVMTPIPLYLGLGGTMFGIIIGLFGMPSVSGELASTATELGIDSLINGVKIAMIASFVGLGLTTYSSWRFRVIKTEIENRKNGFYTFIQSQLLPVLSKSIQSATQALQNDFIKFNDIFSKNIKEFKKVVGNNFKSFQLQNATLEKLENIDLNKLASANVMTFQQMQQSMQDLEKLGTYILTMRQFIDNTVTLSDRVNGVLDRTNQIEIVANEVRNVFDEHRKLQSFLVTHFDELERKGDMLQVVLDKFDDRIKGIAADASVKGNHVAEQFQDYTTQSINVVKEKLIKQYNELEKITLQNPQHLQKLDHLEKVDKNLEQYLKKADTIQNKMIKRLESIEKNTLSTSRKVGTGSSNVSNSDNISSGSFYDLLPVSLQKLTPYIDFGYSLIKFTAVVLIIIVFIQMLLS